MRNGPSFAGYCRYLTPASRGVKHSGSTPGPLTSWGPALALPAKSAAQARAGSPAQRLENARSLGSTVTPPLFEAGYSRASGLEHRPDAGDGQAKPSAIEISFALHSW